MARGRKSSAMLAVAAGVGLWCAGKHASFVPPAGKLPARHLAPVAGAATAALAAASPAFADEIGDAAKKLSEKTYPFLKDIDWNSYLYLLKPGSASAGEWAKAIDSAIVMGAAMDPELLKKGVQIHHKAIGSISERNPVLSMGDYTEMNAAIGRMVASVPESKTMDVYNAFSAAVGKDVPPYLMSQVKADDAKAAYEAFLEFKDVVKAHPITPKVAETPAALQAKLGAIDAAAAKLSAAAYPFIQKVDWASDLYLRPLPGKSPQEVMKAIDKMLVMAASMDGKLLQEGAMAHHNALNNMNANLVTSEADFAATNAAIGKLVASVPMSQTMDVYNAMAKLLPATVGNNLFQMVTGNDAIAAYNGFLNFKDVVKAAAR